MASACKEADFKCSYCDRAFINDDMLEEHIKVQHDNPPKVKETDKKDLNRRIILVGKAGSGKSSAGNVILSAEEGQTNIFEYFKTGFAGQIQTKFNKTLTRPVCGYKLSVVDTPGVSEHSDKAKGIAEEIRQAIVKSDTGYHAIVYVLNIFQTDMGMTDEEIETYKRVNEILGDKFNDYVVLVFTHGASYEDKLKPSRTTASLLHRPNLSFEEVITQDELSLNREAIGPYVKKVNGRAVLFENLDQEAGKRKEMVKKLLDKVEEVIEKQSGPYCKELLPELVEQPEDIQELQPVNKKEIRCSRMTVFALMTIIALIVAILVAMVIQNEGNILWRYFKGENQNEAPPTVDQLRDITQ